jgi:hypothetical protein
VRRSRACGAKTKGNVVLRKKMARRRCHPIPTSIHKSGEEEWVRENAIRHRVFHSHRTANRKLAPRGRSALENTISDDHRIIIGSNDSADKIVGWSEEV